MWGCPCALQSPSESPQRAQGGFREEAEPRKPHLKEGHLTATAGTQWIDAKILICLCFTFVIFRENLPGNEKCSGDVWDYGWAFLQMREWAEHATVNPPSAENNECPTSSLWFWRWPLWKWWVKGWSWPKHKLHRPRGNFKLLLFVWNYKRDENHMSFLQRYDFTKLVGPSFSGQTTLPPFRCESKPTSKSDTLTHLCPLLSHSRGLSSCLTKTESLSHWNTYTLNQWVRNTITFPLQDVSTGKLGYIWRILKDPEFSIA